MRVCTIMIQQNGPFDCFVCLVQVRLGTEVLRTPSSTQPGFELTTSRS